jgi:hypothetical protein
VNTFRTTCIAAAAFLSLLAAGALAQKHADIPSGLKVDQVPASTADPTLKTEYEGPNIVILPGKVTRPELVVYLPGSHGRPRAAGLLATIAAGGYRVIGLMYNDVPSEKEPCGKSQDPKCAALFREERLNGDAPNAPVQNTVNDSITGRLVSLLKYLDRTQPGRGWGAYLAGDQPAWSKIVISGHSQGAGTAAYIAKYHEVARVVMFSGPADSMDEKTDHMTVDPWLNDPSKTPPDRWYGGYHAKEGDAAAFVLTYKALGIPSDHIRIFTLQPEGNGPSAYHTFGPSDERNADNWKFFYGIQ